MLRSLPVPKLLPTVANSKGSHMLSPSTANMPASDLTLYETGVIEFTATALVKEITLVAALTYALLTQMQRSANSVWCIKSIRHLSSVRKHVQHAFSYRFC